MFWEEKIDLLKQKFSPDQFRVPFSDWQEIFKKIESKFIQKDWAAEGFCNWSEGLKEKIHIRDISRKKLGVEILKLGNNQNYWMVVVFSEDPTAKQFVYDCNVDAMRDILSIAPADFYIGHKKYDWLVYCDVNKSENSVSLYKAKAIPTPFD